MWVNHIQNTCFWGNDSPTVSIQEEDEGWELALQNWLNGKNPTDDPEWKKGVFATRKNLSQETRK